MRVTGLFLATGFLTAGFLRTGCTAGLRRATGFVFLAGAFLGKDCIRSCICFMISGGIVGADTLLVGTFGLGADRTRRRADGLPTGDLLVLLPTLLDLPPIVNTYMNVCMLVGSPIPLGLPSNPYCISNCPRPRLCARPLPPNIIPPTIC